jgi:hypothetical protein
MEVFSIVISLEFILMMYPKRHTSSRYRCVDVDVPIWTQCGMFQNSISIHNA